MTQPAATNESELAIATEMQQEVRAERRAQYKAELRRLWLAQREADRVAAQAARAYTALLKKGLFAWSEETPFVVETSYSRYWLNEDGMISINLGLQGGGAE